MSSAPLNQVTNLAQSKVIGWTKTKVKHKKKSDETETMSVGIQAWEIGALLIAVAAYEFVNGPGSFLGPNGLAGGIMTPGYTGNNPLSGVTTLPLTVGLSNPVIL